MKSDKHLYVEFLEYGRAPYRKMTVKLMERMFTETDDERSKRIGKAVPWMMDQYFKKPKQKKTK